MRFVIVCDLPVPGGPWMTKLPPSRARAIAATCEPSAGTTRCRSPSGSSGTTGSRGRGSIENTWSKAAQRRPVPMRSR